MANKSAKGRPLLVLGPLRMCSPKSGCGFVKTMSDFDKLNKSFHYLCKQCRRLLRQSSKYRTRTNQYNRERYLVHKEESRAKKSRRRQRLSSILLTPEEIRQSIEHRKVIKDNPCFYCGKHKKYMHDDHMLPVSRGGTDVAANIVRACADCNIRKGSKTATEFMRALEAIKDE